MKLILISAMIGAALAVAFSLIAPHLFGITA